MVFFVERLLVVLVVVATAAALWRLTGILVLLFGATLLAIGLRAATRTIARIIKIGEAFALSVVIIIAIAIFSAAFWLFGSVVAAQLDEVLQAAPAGIKLFMERLNANPYGRQLLDQARDVNVVGATGWATSVATATVGSITRGIGYGAITIFVAIYLAAQPNRYRRLCIRLVPPTNQKAVERFIDLMGSILKRWLTGQLVVMFTIGLLSGVGLWLLGIEAAFALGLMGGLLCFIPFVGAILAAVPATLVALTAGAVLCRLGHLDVRGCSLRRGKLHHTYGTAGGNLLTAGSRYPVDGCIQPPPGTLRRAARSATYTAAHGRCRDLLRPEGTRRTARE